MVISFRKVLDRNKFQQIVEFLKNDALVNGGSASEIINMHGALVELTVCKVPWGTLIINKPVSRLEALAWGFQDVE